ncbi:MAG TPA: ATP-binding protein [Bacteroidales bacterium]|nr:ATP-binding protein [Bacteroidales bacterium]
MNVIGREQEIEILQDLLRSGKSELVAVYGRRRIGKTFLIRAVYKSHILFEVTGLHNGSMKHQLKNFHQQAVQYFTKTNKFKKPPIDWAEAFSILAKCIDNVKSKNKKVIFIDEFPWMATKRSNFLMWFEHFWNSYCVNRNDLIVVICGSAASYMVNNIIRNKGGLHNRVTRKIRLLPFNLRETKLFLESRNIKLQNYDILMLYMAIGGVPRYLEMIKRGKSVAQNIDDLCFDYNGELRNEFNEVFASLFSNSSTHTAMIKTMAQSHKGLTRKELLENCKLQQSGFTSSVLNELIESGFVNQYTPFSKKNRNSLFRLSDEYCMFFLKFIEPYAPTGPGTWQKLAVRQIYKIWSGFAFETICLKHIQQIKNELGIGKVFTVHSSWAGISAQIDLIIDRDDNRINLCEMKFSNGLFTIDKTTYENLQNKLRCFKEDVKPRKAVYFTFITSFGLKENSYSLNIVENNISIDCLFLS